MILYSLENYYNFSNKAFLTNLKNTHSLFYIIEIMVLDEMTSSSSSSSTISPTSNQETDDHIQRSIYNVIIQNNIKELTEILNNNINFDINQPLKEVKELNFEDDQENEESYGDHKNALMVACSLDCVDIVR